MAEGNLTAAIKHVAVVTSSKWNGENDTERPHWVVPPESLFSGKDERKASTDGNLDYRGDRLYILSIDPEVTKKLVDGWEYYFKWDKLELKNKYGSDMLSAVNTVVSVIQWTGEIGRDSTANGIALTKVITVSKTTGNKNGGNLTFTYRRDSDRPCVSLLVTTGVAESKFKYQATLSVQFGSDTRLELTGLDEPQDTNAINTNELIISNSYYTNRYGARGFYSYTNQNSRAKCALKIPDKLLKPSTTYKVTFDLSSSQKLHSISTGVNFGDKCISSDAKAADKTYTMTFTTPEVLSGDKVLFFAAATVEDWGSGAKTITVKHLIIAPVSKPKPHPKFNLKLEANNSTIKTDETAKLTTTFTNTGNIDLHNASITAVLPAGLSLTGAIEPKEITGDLLQGVKLPTISPDKSVVLSFNVKPNARLLKIGDNPLSVTLNATTDELKQEPDISDNTTTLVVNKPQPKLSFDAAIKADKSTINIGDSVNYTIEFSNTGEVDLHNVNVTSTLPAGLKLVEGSVKSGAKFTGTLAGGLLLTEVKAGDKATITFAATTVKGKLKYGNNELSTSVSATTKELATEDSALLGNNTAKITVVYPKPQPKFNLALEADNLAIKTTETAKLTATFANTGETDLHNTVVTAVLPAGLSLSGAIESKEVTGDLQQGVKLPVIASGKSLTFSFTVKPNTKLLKAGNNPLSVTLNATTDELGQEPDTADNTVTLTVHKPESKFKLKLEVDKSTIKVKETTKLTATFANIGETDLHDVVITGTLPDVVNLASPIGSKGTTGNLQQGIRTPVVTSGKSVALSFVVKPDADLLDIGDNKVTITLSATTKELEQEPDAADNSVDITIQKPEPPKLRPEEVKEVKLANNEILDDNRRELIKPIFKAVKGLSFTPLEITTEGHGWYEIGDRITIENDKEQWQAVITNIKLTIDGGIKEEIKSIAPTATTTNYALAGGIKKTIYNTEIKVDKQKQKIEQIVSRQDKQDTDIKESFTRVKQDLRGINTTIQETGGNNLIYNSVGFDANNSGKLTSWTTTGSAKGQSSLESVASGGNSGNQITLDKSTKIVQRLTVKRGGKYALSFRARKGAAGVAKISLKNTIDDYQIVLEDQHEVMWSDSINKIIVPSEGYFDVIVETDANVAYFAITDLMLNTGDSPVQWVQASGEVLSTGVSVTKQGMKVKSSLHNGDYVEMTPLEFAGYSTVGGSLQRVFSLNRDVTTVQKLSAVKRISMPPIKIVPIEKGEQAGWAFVKTTEE